MVAYLHKHVVEQNGWLDDEEYKNGVALCQMIPGATTMQTAAYIGLKLRGLIGAVVSFTGFGLPAFCLMILLAVLYSSRQDQPVVTAVFGGLQAIIVAIIGNAMLSFGRVTLIDWRAFLIAAIAAGLYALYINPMLVILAAAAVGLVIYWPASATRENLTRSAPHISRQYIRSILVAVIIGGIALLLFYLFDRSMFNLLFVMVKISLFSFGGGYAAVPLMQHEVVNVHGWMDNQTFMNGIVLGQVTPGPVVITATYIGYILSGMTGAVLATTGIFFPSFIILVAIVPIFDHIKSSPFFISIINGILCSFVGLLLIVTVRFGLDVRWTLVHILLAVGALTALLCKVDILWVVLAGTILSAVVYFL
jgi:chromate transporter